MVNFKSSRDIMQAIKDANCLIRSIENVDSPEAMSILCDMGDTGSIRDVLTWMTGPNAVTLYKAWKIKHG